jgi:peptidyl-prolyl cis-trans isomerase B (cyclophilin B)
MFTPLLIAVICLATPTPNRTANPPASMATSESDIEFAVLRTALAGLHRQDHDSTDWAAAARTLRLNARAFTNQFPSDTRGLELEATLSMGLEEDQAVDSAFAQLLRLAPKKTTAGLAWTDYWMARDEAHAFEVLESLIEQRPDAMLYLDRLFRILATKDPQRLIKRFQHLGSPEGDIDQCSHELDMLARLAGPLAAAIGEQLQLAYPDNLDITIATARGYRHANKFSSARRIINELPANQLVDPGHIYLWSDTYYADHHFERALELLELIDMEELSKDDRSGMYRRLGFILPVRKTAAADWPGEQSRRLADASRNDNPIALLTINGREVVMELFEDDAPNTVAAFIAAADLGLYDGYEAGQVHPGFRTIFGDRHEDDGLPSWSLPEQSYQQAPRPILAGSVVGYAESTPGSADTRFFILQFPAPHLNDRKTTFGRVITGLDVVREMAQGDVLDSVKIMRRRDHEYDPNVFDPDMNPMKLSERLGDAGGNASGS